MSIFNKALEATEAWLDNMIAKSRSEVSGEYVERKGMIELSYPDDQQYGYKERTGLVGPGVLKNMARKDSIILAVIKTRLAQVAPYTKPQKDRYSPGWNVVANNPADISEDDKLKLADPSLDDESYQSLKHEMDVKRSKLKQQQEDDIEKIKQFVASCGMPADETDTTHRRWDFSKYVMAIVQDRLIYNYSATELIPTKGGDKVHHFYPLSAGTIKFVSSKEPAQQKQLFKDLIADRDAKFKKTFDEAKPFKYVQVVRGLKVAAFTEDELIFEPATPTVDPEDNGYAPGELEMLIHIVTAHLYAEAHNRNFFSQGLGTKGILHIKGDNISRAQLEAFKRQWFNQVVNTRNAFRPPIISMAEDVKWVSLAQTNQEMEFEKWMQYLIKIACAVFQIDPSEINFDIAKTNTSTLQESNNEERLKNSRDKGLRPLLDYVENIVNNHILRYWNSKLANKYKFKFVGFDAETKTQEIDRLEKETKVWKTLNEARIEMGAPPLEDGDVVLNATYTQYKQMKLQQQQATTAAETQGEPNVQDNQENEGISSEITDVSNEINQAVDEATQETAKEQKTETSEETKKSQATIIEYYLNEDSDNE